MSIFKFNKRLSLNAPVGNNLENQDEDVRIVRTALEDLGYFGESERERDVHGKPLGMITAQMDQKIRGFQQKENLKVDGRLNPDGETITTLSKKMDEKEKIFYPPKKPRILNHSDNERILDEMIRNEDNKEYMYKDSTGHVTVGIGKLLKNVDDAKALSFVRYKFLRNDETGKPIYEILGEASEKEIEKAFKKIKKDGKINYKADYYDPSYNRNYLPIKLSHETRKVLALSSLFEHSRILRARFNDFDNFPPSAQEALLDLQYNTGLKPADWDEFYKAVNAQDWDKAAKESNRRDVSKDRNDKIFDLFKKAQSSR